MQVKVMLLESFDDRVTSFAALKPNEIKKNIGAGGALVPSPHLSPHQLLIIIGTPDGESNKQSELFTSLETRLFDQKMRNMMIPTQLPVVAAAGGVVISQEFHPAYGNMIKIAHGNDLMTQYAHASKPHVKRGDLIKRGQKIAEVGSTGRSTGPHLHFEVWVQGIAQDPQKFLVAGKNLPPSPDGPCGCGFFRTKFNSSHVL